MKNYTHLLVASITLCLLTHSLQNSASAQEQSAKRRIVDELVSANESPLLPERRAIPSFGSRFDWLEQERVWRVVVELCKTAQDNWDDIVSALNRVEYSVTIRTFNGSTYNWSVGDVCRRIAARTLSDSYFVSMEPMSREVYATFREPEFSRDTESFRKWLNARPRRSLAALQADACDWAVQRLADRADEERGDWSDKNRDRWISEIKKTVVKLRSGGLPNRCDGFGHEEFVPYAKRGEKKN